MTNKLKQFRGRNATDKVVFFRLKNAMDRSRHRGSLTSGSF
jgi:hypothetical protein